MDVPLLAPTISYLVRNGKGYTIIMGVTHLRLLGPFCYIALYWAYKIMKSIGGSLFLDKISLSSPLCHNVFLSH